MGTNEGSEEKPRETPDRLSSAADILAKASRNAAMDEEEAMELAVRETRSARSGE